MITMASHGCERHRWCLQTSLTKIVYVNNDQQRLHPGTEGLDLEIREGGLGNPFLAFSKYWGLSKVEYRKLAS